MIYPQPTDMREMAQLVIDRPIEEWVTTPGTALNIGAGIKGIRGAIPLDLPGWDADKDPIPYDDGTISTIYAIHFLEHVRHPVAVLRECQRVLRPGGVLNIGLPNWTSQVAFQDIDHKSFWCVETWRTLFDNPYYAKEHDGWKFDIGANFIFGIVERNVMLITQLIKRDDD